MSIFRSDKTLSTFRSDKIISIARTLKALLDHRSQPTYGSVPDINQRKKQAEKLRKARQHIKRQRNKNKELAENRRIVQRYISGQRERSAKKDEEIFRLKNELRATKEQLESLAGNRAAPQEAVGSRTGALPDFVIIGAMKCGTTSLYNLLSQHPHVEPAAQKELRYFDRNFDNGVEWYRSQFPAPRWQDGRRTVTGEATPYLPDPSVPERMAQQIPQARLIVLLRNPVDRAYSHYHHMVKQVRESRRFEKAIIEAERTQQPGHLQYLSTGIYVDQLVRWSSFFSDEQILVLKSEDFLEHTQGSMKLVLSFLDLPDWEFPVARFGNNRGYYRQKMDPAIRVRLQEYFEPHNQRLYEYLGADFGW